MNLTAVSVLPSPIGASRGAFRILAGVAIIQIVSALLAIWLGWGLAFAPLIALTMAVVLLKPQAGVYILIALSYFKFAVPGSAGIYPADVVSLLLIAGVAMGRLLNGESILYPTRFNHVLIAILVVFGISIVQAHSLGLGIVNWFRHLQLFALTVAVACCIRESDIWKLIRMILFLTAVISLGNVIAFVMVEGGARIFGPAGPFFPTFLAACICQSAVGFLFASGWSSRLGWMVLWLLYITALICTQTREVMVEVLLATLLLFFLGWRWGKTHRQGGLRRRILLLCAVLSIVGLGLFTGALSIFKGPSDRVVQAVEGRAQTVDYRLFLWKTGLKVFAESPVLGIGLGQVQNWDEIIPYWRLDPLSMMTKGLGAHNDFITYIAETGLLGMTCLLVLFWLLFTYGRRMLKRSQTTEQAQAVLMLWLPICALLMRFFFGTHLFYSLSGILTAFQIGLLIKYGQSVGADELPAQPIKTTQP